MDHDPWLTLKALFPIIGKYKLCSDHVLIELDNTDGLRISEDNNEKRSNAKEKCMAKYRSKEMFVKRIYDFDTNKWLAEYLHVPNRSDAKPTCYIVGKWVQADSWDVNDLQTVCTHGIHYFNHLAAAYCYSSRPLISQFFFEDDGCASDVFIWNRKYKCSLKDKKALKKILLYFCVENILQSY